MTDHNQQERGSSEREPGVAEAAKSLASDALGAASDTVKERMDDNVQGSAAYIARIAEFVRTAAEELSADAPLVAGLATKSADKLDDLSDSLASKSATELLDMARETARRNPALVFGIAATVGFLAFRTFKSRPVEVEDLEQDEAGDQYERA